MTTTSTTSATSATATATQQLLTSLGTGSGVDTGALVTSLVEAEFADRRTALTTKTTTLTSQISGVSTVKSAITGFAAALQTLVKGGSLTTQPTSSNPALLTATALDGAKLAGLSKTVEVDQIAAAQMAVTTGTDIKDRTQVLGSGDFTLQVGPATYDASGAMTAPATTATFHVDNASFDTLAAAINAGKYGVTASVVTDADGTAYLSLKGTTGAANAFTLHTDSADLARFNVDPTASGTRQTAQAADAKLVVDGIAVTRSSNSISDLIDGVKLQLVAADGTKPVSLSATAPTAVLNQAVSDFVDTYNQVLGSLKEQTDPITGALRADPAAQTLLRQLRGLTQQTLLTGAASGTPTTLAELGVATNRDGTLKVNAGTLSNALAAWPASVEAMFALSATSSDGITATLNALSTAATDKTTGLGASETRYTAAKDDAAAAQDKLDDQASQETTRLTQQFATMNARVAAYKSTQAFLKNQIDAWNSKDS